MSQGAFSDRLVEAIRAAGAPACVGLDPVLERLPEALRAGDPVSAIGEFCRAVLGAVAGVCPVVKVQSACFERYGSGGVGLLRELIARARAEGLLVILDAKRGDIGVTAEHYAEAAFAGEGGADALTVNGYLGPDAVTPLIRPGRGVFVLVRTSNPGSDAVQSARLADGRTVAELMADHVAALGAAHLGRHGYSEVGAVVGATKAEDGRALRARMPEQFFLVPGYGAQGGTAEDIRAMLDGRPECGGGVLVTASRSVIYAFDAGDAGWAKAVKRAALKFASEIQSVVG